MGGGADCLFQLHNRLLNVIENISLDGNGIASAVSLSCAPYFQTTFLPKKPQAQRFQTALKLDDPNYPTSIQLQIVNYLAFI